MSKTSVFYKQYEHSDLADLSRDISEAIDEDFNPVINNLKLESGESAHGPMGTIKGKFEVSIEFIPEDSSTHCCKDALSTNGWRHNHDCKNWVMCY